MFLPCGPDAAQTVEVLIAVQRQLADAVSRLTDVGALSRAVATQTDWRTEAAALFHANAEAFRRALASLADDVAGAGEHVGRQRARVEARAWGWGE